MSKVTNKNAGNKKGGNPLLAARALSMGSKLASNETVKNLVGSQVSNDPKELMKGMQNIVGKNSKQLTEGINNLQSQFMGTNNTDNSLINKAYTLPGKLNEKHIPTEGSLLNTLKTNTSENHINNVNAIPQQTKEGETILQKKMNRGPKPFIENYEDSFYIAVAIALKSVLRYIWEFIVIVVTSTYKLFSDLVLTPIFIFLPYLFDVTAVILVTICIILIIIYFVSGGSKRKPNNMFDNIFNGFKGLVFPKITLYDKNTVDEYTEEVTGIFGKFINIFNVIGEKIYDNIIREILSLFIINPSLDDLSENDKHVRNHKKEGRCDNLGLIESKDGRYCYEQLDKKHIEWNNQEIPYKLLERKNMKNKGKNVHFDYYVPNCKGSNLFTREFITSCKDSKRTKFVCRL